MSARDFNNKGRLQKNIKGLSSFLRRDNGKVAIIIKRGRQVIRRGEAIFGSFTFDNPIRLKQRIDSIERPNKVKFRGWKTQFQPKNHGSRIFLVFS